MSTCIKVSKLQITFSKKSFCLKLIRKVFLNFTIKAEYCCFQIWFHDIFVLYAIHDTKSGKDLALSCFWHFKEGTQFADYIFVPEKVLHIQTGKYILLMTLCIGDPSQDRTKIVSKYRINEGFSYKDNWHLRKQILSFTLLMPYVMYPII